MREDGGRTPEDLSNARQFCTDGITKGIAPNVSRVVGYGSILEIHVDREMAIAMQRSTLDTKRTVLVWMKLWKQITGKPSVMVEVEWEGIPIVTGDFSLFGGDQVEIH